MARASGFTAGTIRWPVVSRAVTVALLIAAAARLAHFLITRSPEVWDSIGIDYRIVTGAAQEWLSGDSFYPPWQLEGPFPVATRGEILYPPTALPLFAAFTVLPAILWWAVPIGATIIVVARFRPAWWAWPVLAFLLLLPRTQTMVLWGNPSMWIVAAVAGGLAWGWPGSFVLIKPSLFPFAAAGIRTRGWWIVLGATLTVTLPFLYLWPQWFTVIQNVEAGPLYSLTEVPTLCIPVIAWAARRPRPRERATTSGAAEGGLELA
jgi:hypothetical protein